jgi:hypothetical protein
VKRILRNYDIKANTGRGEEMGRQIVIFGWQR